MSQYLIIFLIVAVFRGVVWVVQKVQQNAKAREALMAQRAGAHADGAAPVGGTQTERAARQMASEAAASAREAAPTPRAAAPAAARAPKPPQRGQAKRADRGASARTRGGSGARAGMQPAGTTSARVPAPAAPGWAVGAAQARVDQGARPVPPPRQVASSGAPSSRAEAREARVGQSSRDVRRLLLDRSSLRQALLAREILGPPRGLTP